MQFSHAFSLRVYAECIFFVCVFTPFHVELHSDPLCDFCHFKHPLSQCSVTEHLLCGNLLMSDPPERGRNKEQEEDFTGFFSVLFRCFTSAVLRNCKVFFLC